MKPINKKLKRISKLFTPVWFLLSLMRRQSDTSTAPREILIFDFHLIGDIVMLTPLLKAIKCAYPNARLVLVAGSWAKEILVGTRLVDEIIPFSAPWVKYGQGFKGLWSCFKLVNVLRETTWDLGIEVRGDIRQILMLWLVGAKRRVGFDFTGGAPLLTDVVSDDGSLTHITDHHQRICKYLEIWNNDEQYYPFLSLTSDEQQKADLISPYVAFHFGASMPLRRLPAGEVVELLSKFELSQTKLTVFLPPDDIEFAQILKQLPNSLQSKIEIWSGSLREFIVYISRAIHFYGMDSGPAHIASALKVPITVFFGPAESEYVRPVGESIEIMSKPGVSCRPCNQVKCTNNVDQYCMQGLALRIDPVLVENGKK